MSDSSETHETDNSIELAGTENSLSEGVVTGATDRIPDDETAAMVERLRIAQTFDDAEARAPTPEPLEGRPATGGQHYRVEGETDAAWLEASYTIAVGGER